MDNEKFGKFIKSSRKEKGLTQKQLADMLHVSDKTISKWENGIGFPDIKLLEPLAESLDVSLLELMQSERAKEPKISMEAAEKIVSDTITRSEKEKEHRRRMWKVKILLGACVCAGLYLLWVGLSSFAGQGMGAADAQAAHASAWYEAPMLFYIWSGLLVILCGGAAVFILSKSEQAGSVKIGLHRIKSVLTILIDMLVVLLLHTYISNIANNQEQLMRLPQAIPVHAHISTLTGGQRTGIFIRDEVVKGLMESVYVENLKLDVRLKAGPDQAVLGQWDTLPWFVEGINCLKAVGGISEPDVVWNTGEDESVFQGTEAKCVVSKKLFEEKGWKLGDKVNLCQCYYYREDERYTLLRVAVLDTTEYEIVGYTDLAQAGIENFTVPPDILVPFRRIRESHIGQDIPFFASAASFDVADALELNAFKKEMRELGLKSVSPAAEDYSVNGVALRVNDLDFINAANHLKRTIDTVQIFFPFLLILIVCVGYLATLLLLQSRKNEMALLRSLGLNRRKCFRIFFTDQLVLVAAGVVAGSVFSVLLQGNYGGSSALTGCLVGICYMLGNSLAIWKLLGVSVMEALFQAE